MRLTILSDPELWKRIAAWPAMKPANNTLSTETGCIKWKNKNLINKQRISNLTNLNL